MSAVEKYAVPRTLEEATELLSENECLMFAGSTDVLPQTRSGKRAFKPALVNIRRIDALRGIERDGRSFRLGALTTVTEILESELLKEHAPVLVEAADSFACGQIRNTATLGGNLCNASPAGDLIPPLLLLDAEVELASRSEGRFIRRRLPLCEFFLGPGKTRLEPTEVLTHVHFDAPGERFVASFRKFGTRPAMDIAVVSIALGCAIQDGVVTRARVAFGAAAPTPLRGLRTEALLEGQALDEETLAAAAATAREEIHPISDVRGSAWYRRELVQTLTERLLRHVARAEN
jgi:CO/xanthine dehydrogenase FAD-binding subunit